MKNCVVLEETSVHDEQYKWKTPLDIGNTNVEKTRAIDFYDEIKKDRRTCFKIFNIRPTEIWLTVSGEINDKHKTWKGMSDVQVKHYVKNVRSKDNGTGILRSLECTPLLMVQDYSFFFFTI